MLQLTQKLRDGSMMVQEVPAPQLAPGMVLVRNHYSLISAGTEGSTAKAARKSLLGKMKDRPDQVRQVLNVVRRNGMLAAYRAVTKKLEAYSPCGYSSAGVVEAVGEGVTGFAAGDKVACAGAGFASHAEIVAVPVNLCVKLLPDADLSMAAYNTMGAIAMQGVRQADVRLGDNVVVIGLGLLGRLTGQLLKASGARVVGIDVSSAAAAAAAVDFDLALERSTAGIEQRILDFCQGEGADSVIITAATSSLDPINFAGRIARKKATVVVVGAVPTGFDRNPDYYPKELTVKMSCSYGPGRYDSKYEEQGIDYPYGYVRWTEQRNMLAFQQLIAAKKIDLAKLTTHRFALTDAPRAYDMIVNRTEPFLGVILEYDVKKTIGNAPVSIRQSSRESDIRVAFIGAGSYAQGNLLPNLPGDIARIGVMTNSGTTSKRVAERFDFSFCTANAADILDNEQVNTVFIATRHDSHAHYVEEALAKGKNVFVEKPLALNMEELDRITALLPQSRGQLMVGFNRRFAPLTAHLKQMLPAAPKIMIYRVNAGSIPAGNWIQDPKIGGGRMIGEGCHFIDYMSHVADALPVMISAAAIPDAQGLNDTLTVNIVFSDGSVGTLCYCANGSSALAKEYFEVHCAGTSATLSDFHELNVFGCRNKRWKAVQDKGQHNMIREFFAAIREGRRCIDPAALCAVTRATFAVGESLKSNQTVRL